MQFPAHWADQLGEPPFDRHMNVFVLRAEGEPFAVEFGADPPQAVDQGLRLTAGQDARPFEPPTMGDAALDILSVQASIDGER